jgi:hypothetical protein
MPQKEQYIAILYYYPHWGSPGATPICRALLRAIAEKAVTNPGLLRAEPDVDAWLGFGLLCCTCNRRT